MISVVGHANSIYLSPKSEIKTIFPAITKVVLFFVKDRFEPVWSKSEGMWHQHNINFRKYHSYICLLNILLDVHRTSFEGNARTDMEIPSLGQRALYVPFFAFGYSETAYYFRVRSRYLYQVTQSLEVLDDDRAIQMRLNFEYCIANAFSYNFCSSVLVWWGLHRTWELSLHFSGQLNQSSETCALGEPRKLSGWPEDSAAGQPEIPWGRPV